MNVLITGCAGFIASHIIEELLKDVNNNIVGIDNFFSGKKENIEFLEGIDKNKKFKFIEADIRKIADIDKIVKQNEIEQIYHLAAVASVQVSIQKPIFSNDVNLNGSLNILEVARINGVKRVVFSSSAAVYGDEQTLPKNENSTLKPISPYGCQKLMTETYMKLYSDLYGLETVSLRYFNVYGQRQDPTSDYSGVISIFDNKFKNSETPLIFGDGNQYRDFIHVKDVVDANIKAMNMDNISGEVFCVGSGVKTSINELFFVMNKKYQKEYEPKYLPARKGDIRESVCENEKLKDILKIKEFKKFEDEILKL